MSNDLLKQLEEKITAAIETIELSRMELTELKEQNNELENRYVDWEDRLSALIEKFEQLENEDIVEIEAGSETPIQKEEEENIEELGAEENEADEQAVEISADVDETENPVFGTSPESFTEAPESAQHYA
ncbi:MAG: cell division protein ZapB [SAR324 cluster bacterium]|nr:cell division protein ZapB [SAR324 cluster bacterium]